MGILDDLIQTIKEAVDEAKGQTRPRTQPTMLPSEVGVHPIDLIRQRMIAQRNAEAAAEAAPPPPPRRLAPPPKLRPPPVALAVSRHARIYQMLRQPDSLRELMLIKEILDRPLAHRRRS